MRQALRVAALGTVVALAACETPAPIADEPMPAHLTMTVETPQALDWGGSGVLRVTLTNEGEFAADGGIVQVHVPTWLEFGRVEPAGTAVTVVSGDDETRLSYQLTDSLPPGAQRSVVQHLRVRYDRPTVAAAGDTVDTLLLPPTNQVVRARLLTPAGEPTGAEVQATLHFAGASGLAPQRPAPERVPADTALRMPGRDTLRDTLRTPASTRGSTGG
jgi:hypothetical protein